MNILFLYFEFRKDIVDANLIEIGVASSLLKANDHDVSMLYLKSHPDTAALKERLASLLPDIVISFIDYDQVAFISPVLDSVKAVLPLAKSICVGTLCGLNPDILISNPAVDMLIIGEFEMTLLEIIINLARNNDIQRVQNLWLKTQREVVKNPLRSPLANLDSLPFPDRTIYNHQNIVSFRNGAVALSASRGCPYQCAFCNMSPLGAVYSAKGSYYRFRSPAHLLSEIVKIAETTEFKKVLFCDSQFPLETEWLREFSGKYSSVVGKPFQITSSIELIARSGIIETLAATGCSDVTIGLETGNESFRRRFSGRNLNNQQILEVSARLHAANIRIHTTTLVGLPLETPDLARETFEFNKKIAPESITPMTYYPPPATHLYKYAHQKNYIRTHELPQIPFESVMDLPFMKPEEIKEAYLRLHLLDSVLRVKRHMHQTAGYFNFISSFARAFIEGGAPSDIAVEHAMLEDRPALAIRQKPNTRIAFDCKLRESSFLQMYVGLKKIPAGDFIPDINVNFSIELQQGQNRELIFERILHSGNEPYVRWHRCHVPLLEVHPGVGRIIFSLTSEEAFPHGIIWGCWGEPLLGDKVFEKDGRIEVVNEEVHNVAKRIKQEVTEKQAQIDELKKSLERIARENRDLTKNLDKNKERITELNRIIEERDNTIDEFKQKIQELERIRELYEKSISGKLGKLFKGKQT